MRKVIIKGINNYDYILVDQNNNIYNKNMEFYSKYKPKVNDIMYVPEQILKETNLYAFKEVQNIDNDDEYIKIINDNKEYLFQRVYG